MGIHLDLDGAVRGIREPPTGPAAVHRVEGHGCEPASLIRLPFVDGAVAVGVFFGARGEIGLIELGSRDAAIPSGRDGDTGNFSVRTHVRPRVLHAIVGPRQADPFQLPRRIVVLPALDLPVLVLVDLDPEHPRPVHVADGVDLAVAVRVVLELPQAPGVRIVDGLDVLLRGVCHGSPAPRARNRPAPRPRGAANNPTSCSHPACHQPRGGPGRTSSAQNPAGSHASRNFRTGTDRDGPRAGSWTTMLCAGRADDDHVVKPSVPHFEQHDHGPPVAQEIRHALDRSGEADDAPTAIFDGLRQDAGGKAARSAIEQGRELHSGRLARRPSTGTPSPPPRLRRVLSSA